MGIFDGFIDGKKENDAKKEENAQRIQRYLNKYHMVTRDLDNTESMRENDAKKDSSSAYAWQAYTWIEDATATSSERENRYREYKEMCKVPELNQGLNIYCLHPDTIINTLKGNFTIKELADGVLGEKFEVWSYNVKKNKVDIGKARDPHVTLKNTDVYKVKFDNGSEIIATDNHPFLLKTGEYKKLKRLTPEDDVIFLEDKISYHKVILIEHFGKSDVYDMEVEEFHNFNANRIFVHNSDNATQYNINNNVLEIISDNQRIVEALDKLFFERLDINSNLWSYTKNMCKFGDEFVEVIVDSPSSPKNILSLERIKKPENLKRKEKNNKLDGFEYNYGQEKEKEAVKYQPWQIIHFSIEDDEYEPYGKSIFESGRKTWKRLSLMEDAMLVYRISRAPERRVFYIDVGTLSTKDANQYIEQLKRKFKKKSFVNSNTGEIDEKANPLCITLDTKIPLLDGRALSLSDLIAEYNSGKENWVYSIDTNNKNQITPGKIIWAGETRKDAKLVKITLDNGKELRTTPDHRFMLRDGSYIEAQYLTIGQALMPWYTKPSSKEDGDKINGYLKIYNPASSEYEFVHRVVCNTIDEWRNREYTNPENNKTIHHIDFNKLNNSPNNLKIMSFSDHRNLHHTYSYRYNDIRSKNLKKQFSDPELRQKYLDGMTISNKLPQDFWSKLISIAQTTESNSQNYISFDNVVAQANQDQELITLWNSFCQNRQKNKINRNFMSRAILSEYSLKTTEAWLSEICQVRTKKDGVTDIKKVSQGYSEKMKNQEQDILNNYIYKIFDNRTVFTPEITKFCKKNNFYYTYIKNILVRNNYTVENPARNDTSIYKNHKVAKIEWLNYTEDTGDITIEKYHNFATESGVIVHNSVDEDFFIAVRENSQGTRIETLPPGMNLGEIDDVKYFRDMILKTLGIPIGYLGGAAEGGATYDSKSYLSNQEVQFARTIERIQKFIVKGLEKVGIIQLALQKFEGDDLKNFKIKLTPPSNVDQLIEMEIRTQQFTLIQSIKAIVSSDNVPLLPDDWVYKNILGFSDKEISTIKLQIQMQTQLQAQMQTVIGNMASGGGGAVDMGSMAGPAPEMAGGPAPEVNNEPPEAIATNDENPSKPGLEISDKTIEFDGGKWLLENEKDAKKLLKYINLYEKIHKDNNDKKRIYEQNSATRMTMKGEFTGLLNAFKSSNKNKTLNE